MIMDFRCLEYYYEINVMHMLYINMYMYTIFDTKNGDMCFNILHFLNYKL